MTDSERTTDERQNEELVQAALEHVRHQLSWEIEENDLPDVRGNVERHLKLAEKLRSVQLRNADEPDFVFQPYRAEG